MIQVKRSEEVPASLATQKSWRGRDVLKQLSDDFHGKCYLCEGTLPRAWDVDHLKPRAAGGAEYDWKNLFPACHMCNIRRLKWGSRGIVVDGSHKAWPVGGMLDTTTDDIEGRLLQSLAMGLGPGDTTTTFSAREVDDESASNTAEELTHLHSNGSDDARTLRGYIYARHQELFVMFRTYLKAPRSDKARHIRTLRANLSPKAPYAALMRQHFRSFVKDKPHLLQQLGLQ